MQPMKLIFSKLTSLTLLTQIICGYIAYFLLLGDNNVGYSITHYINSAHSLPIKQHLLMMGCLPIYIAAVIFGAAMLGTLVGHWLEEQLITGAKEKNAKSSIAN
jgi:ABC-type transport system involved in cytochrome c biogenesis permease component